MSRVRVILYYIILFLANLANLKMKCMWLCGKKKDNKN